MTFASSWGETTSVRQQVVLRVESFIEPEDVDVTYTVGGVEKTDRFAIYGIPAWKALPFYRRTETLLVRGDISSAPDEVVKELLKYASCGDETLRDEESINRHCASAEVVLALAVAVWNKNFGFYKTRKFPKGSVGLVEYTGVDPLFATVIHHGHATLWDIKNRYTLEDVYTIWEADFVPDENDSRLRKHAIEEAKMKKGGR